MNEQTKHRKHKGFGTYKTACKFCRGSHAHSTEQHLKSIAINGDFLTPLSAAIARHKLGWAK